MKYYELTFLIDHFLGEEGAANVSQKIQELITREEQGVLINATPPFFRRLAYPIKKKKEAFLVSLNFHIGPEKLADLNKKIKAEQQILRHLIVASFRQKGKSPKLLTKKTPAGPAKLEKEMPKKPEKVELKELDQKIEEILKE